MNEPLGLSGPGFQPVGATPQPGTEKMIDVPQLAGLVGRRVVLETSSFGRPRLYVEGEPKPLLPRRGRWQLATPTGDTVVVRLRPRTLGLDPVPDLEVNGQRVVLRPPLPRGRMAWAAMPVALVFVGGLIGGLIGAGAAVANVRLLSVPQVSVARYALTAMLTLGAVVAYIVVVGLLAGGLALA